MIAQTIVNNERLGIPRSLEFLKHFYNPTAASPVTGLRVSINTGRSSFFGEKYSVEKVR
jgi:hypothetical protein